MVYKLTHLDLDFEPDLHDLRGGHAEISCREVGVEVHRQTAIPGTLLSARLRLPAP
jgi:hypothetical protein